MTDREYLSCAETAKLVRKALASAFPGVKFSVRSQTYAGGASINVGIPKDATVEDKAVRAVCERFAGGRFDGMIDLAYCVNHWLLPDGTVQLASSPGSESSGGYASRIPLGAPPCPGARLVRLGADSVWAQRNWR